MRNKDSRPRAGDRSVLEENLLCGEGPSRREVLKTGTAIAVSAGRAQLLACDAAAQGQDRDAAALEQLRRANGDARRRVLLKGGTIISMDTTVADFARADLLIEGKKISVISPDLDAVAQSGNAIVVDASDKILITGIIPNSATIGDYMGATHRGFAPYYRPDDMYVGNLITALGCMDAGITCFIDNSQNSRRSEEH